MNEQDERFEQNASKYLDFGKKGTPSEEEARDMEPEIKDIAQEELPQNEEEQTQDVEEEPNEEEYQPTEEEQQQAEEIEAKMKAQYDEILAWQKQYKVELPKEVEDLVKQREEFFKNNDMEALIKKMQGYVNPESDKLLITWIVTRFPQLFKRLTEEEQKALIRHYNLSI